MGRWEHGFVDRLRNPRRHQRQDAQASRQRAADSYEDSYQTQLVCTRVDALATPECSRNTGKARETESELRQKRKRLRMVDSVLPNGSADHLRGPF